MNRLAQEAVLISLTRQLHERGSWTGETHLQKATYLLHELGGVPFEFDFILYKHGPFSFELRDELGSMRADLLLDRHPQPPPYGPRISVTERGEELENRFARTMARFGPAVDWVADQVADRDVMELERLATALWVTREHGEERPVESRAAALREVKPHVPHAAAVSAVQRIDVMLADSASLAA